MMASLYPRLSKMFAAYLKQVFKCHIGRIRQDVFLHGQMIAYALSRGKFNRIVFFEGGWLGPGLKIGKT